MRHNIFIAFCFLFVMLSSCPKNDKPKISTDWEHQPVSVYIPAKLVNGFSAKQLFYEAITALNPQSDFKFAIAESKQNADVIVSYYEEPWTGTGEQQFGGKTYYSSRPMRIEMNTYILTDNAPVVFKACCMHELGHVMGLTHSSKGIMAPNNIWSGRVFNLDPSDVILLNEKY